MGVSDIKLFYDQYVNTHKPKENSFIGHFNFLLWENLKKDLSSCQRFQRKPFFKIGLVSGIATYESKSRKSTITGYNIIFSAPLSRFAFTTDDEQFTGKYCVCSAEFLLGTNSFNQNTVPIFDNQELYIKSLSKTQYEELLALFGQIEDEYKSVYIYRQHLIQNRIFDVIHYIQKLDERFYKRELINSNGLGERFLETLEQAFHNLDKEKSLESKSPSYYADLLNTTVDNLNLRLKTSTGMTTQSIIHKRVVEEANVLLRFTNLSVKEIAWRLSFQEASHFQNFYKKHTGCTPSEYRSNGFFTAING
jgi:AraC family transcriptional activator of pobA